MFPLVGCLHPAVSFSQRRQSFQTATTSMRKKTSVAGTVEGFAFPCRAAQDTSWVADPANPTKSQTGLIRQGETIWLQAEPFGSGPVWQLARLADQTLCFVQPHHFDPVVPKQRF